MSLVESLERCVEATGLRVKADATRPNNQSFDLGLLQTRLAFSGIFKCRNLSVIYESNGPNLRL